MDVIKYSLFFILLIFSNRCTSLSQETKKLLAEIDKLMPFENDKIGEALKSLSDTPKDKRNDLRNLDSNVNTELKKDLDKDIRELDDVLAALTRHKKQEDDINKKDMKELHDELASLTTHEKHDEIFSRALKEELQKLLNKEDAPEKKEAATPCVDRKSLNYCYNEALSGACENDTNRMGVECKRTCRLCCEDEKSYNCTLIYNLNYCNHRGYQDRLRVLCPKTCGFCGRAPADIPCVSSEHGCCWDGSIAKDHLGTVDDGCPECKDKFSKKFCKRFIADCANIWGKAGQQMRLFCPLTCRACGPNRKCEDHPDMADSCYRRKYEGSCETNIKAMKYSCAKTCNLCKHTTIPCSKTKYGCCADGKTIAQNWLKKGCQECNDAIDEKQCEILKDHRACEQNKDRMKYYCPHTCGFCDYKK